MKETKNFGICVLVACLCIALLAMPVFAADTHIIYTVRDAGENIEGRITGPGLPPANWNPQITLARVSSVEGNQEITDVPALLWSYGCSATSASMLFGYYDRQGYSNIYTGPTNGGIFPLTNEVWGLSAVEPGEGETPLSASHIGIDGRTTNGHVDDYYGGYLSKFDPYYNNWIQHSPLDSVGDYMGTNQFINWRNVDGSTTFFYNTNNLPVSDYIAAERLRFRDGAHGMKLFAQSKGYTVTTNYNQYIAGYGGKAAGFTYNQYKAEIDAGYPVLIQLNGHSMLGVGYYGTDQIIVHDTWDYQEHTMTWGGNYGGMAQVGVTVFHLAPLTPTGSISITSSPVGASISLDGVDKQVKTPATLTQITPGTHTIKLTKLGYKPYTTQVIVVAGKTATVTATLNRRF
jgi:hypothetical protein